MGLCVDTAIWEYGCNDPVDAYERAVAVKRALGLKS